VKLSRRKFLHLAAGAAAAPGVPRSAWAQAYLTRPITLVLEVSGLAEPCGRRLMAIRSSWANGVRM
jgi:hypothetical protein